MSDYRWSASWTIEAVGDRLRVSAGADAFFDTEAMSPDDVARVLRLLGSPRFARPERDNAQDLFDQLVVLGAIVPVLPSLDSKFTVEWMGNPWHALVAMIDQASPGALRNDGDLQLVIRTTATWSSVLQQLDTVSAAPYLFVDAAYHHTLSLGPFVIPGDTACAGCLAGRLRERWGDEEPPPVPAVQSEAMLVAALVVSELKRCASNNSSLINATSAWDLKSGNARREALYRVPRCPHCSQTSMGRVDLPWAT